MVTIPKSHMYMRSACLSYNDVHDFVSNDDNFVSNDDFFLSCDDKYVLNVDFVNGRYFRVIMYYDNYCSPYGVVMDVLLMNNVNCQLIEC